MKNSDPYTWEGLTLAVLLLALILGTIALAQLLGSLLGGGA